MNFSFIPACISIEYYTQQHEASNIRIPSFPKVRENRELLITIHNLRAVTFMKFSGYAGLLRDMFLIL